MLLSYNCFKNTFIKLYTIWTYTYVYNYFVKDPSCIHYNNMFHAFCRNIKNKHVYVCVKTFLKHLLKVNQFHSPITDLHWNFNWQLEEYQKSYKQSRHLTKLLKMIELVFLNQRARYPCSLSCNAFMVLLQTETIQSKINAMVLIWLVHAIDKYFLSVKAVPVIDIPEDT